MKRFGLVGKSIEHSFSARFFNEKFALENLPGHRYDLFPLNDPSEIRSLAFETDDLVGLNVTIPFKKSVIPFLDEMDEVSSEIGAVNTVRIYRSGNEIKLKGFNTDSWGFEHSTNAFDSFMHALILGTGGAANAVAHVLKKRKIDFRMVSRHPKNNLEVGYNELDEKLMGKYHLIINTTPLGMFPNNSAFPPVPYHLITKNHFLYDLIYNPEETQFLAKGKLAGAVTQNGLEMLFLQAVKSWELWNE